MPGNLYLPTVAQVEAWPTPNFTDPATRPWLPAFAISWQVVATILAGGRFYLRLRKQAGSFGWDDFLIAVSWLFALGLTISACIATLEYDLDRHTWDIPRQYWVSNALIGWLCQVFFLFSTLATKLSVLLFYRRMLKDAFCRLWMIAVWVLIGLNIAGYFAFVVIYCTICTPLSAYWQAYAWPLDLTNYTCLDGDSTTIASGFLIALSDALTVVIPCIMLRNYKFDVPRRQRIALDVIFGLGAIATGVGMARTYYLWQLGHDEDINWQGFNLLVTSVLECQLGIICACAPALRAFFRVYFGEFSRRSLPGDSRSSRHRSKDVEEMQHPPVIAMRVFDSNRNCMTKEDVEIAVLRKSSPGHSEDGNSMT